MKARLSKNTLKIRHWLIKNVLAPKLYCDAILPNKLVAVPRPMILFIKETTNAHDLIGAEIGVSAGINAESIIETLPVKLLYLVDPYEEDIETQEYQKPQLNQSRIEEEAHKRMLRFDKRVKFIKKRSDDAVDDLPDDMDFCYIDGNHSYEFVRNDIKNYFPKIRPGGVLGGHDFFGSYAGVCIAVVEFAKENNLKLLSQYADWWVVK